MINDGLFLDDAEPIETLLESMRGYSIKGEFKNVIDSGNIEKFWLRIRTDI